MANYHYRELGGIKRPNGEKIVKPEFTRTTTRTTDDLIGEMKHHSALSPIVLKAALDALAASLPCFLAEGDSVNIDGVGVLMPSLRLVGVKDVDEADEEGNMVHHNARHIEFDKVRYRPSRKLIAECRRRCQPKHDKFVEDQKPLDTPFTLDERIALVRDFLKENGLIHVKDYRLLTGLCQTTARLELDRFCQKPIGLLCKMGAGTHKYYILQPVKS